VICIFNVPNMYADLLWDGGYREFSEGLEGEIDMITVQPQILLVER